MRWEGVPITFKTNWLTDAGNIDVRTTILVHDAMEREFCIDVDERKIILNSIEECFDFIMMTHQAI